MRVSLATAALISFIAQAAATEVDVTQNNVSLKVLLPENYCALDPAIEGHKKLLDFAAAKSQGQNDVLVIAGPCTETADIAAGKLNAMAQSYVVLAPTQAKGLDLTGKEQFSLTGVCQDLKRAAGGGSAEPDLGRLEAQTAAVLENLKSGDLVPIGLYREGANFCMNGFALKKESADGKSQPSVILSAMTVWKGVLIQALHTIVYEDRLYLQRDVEQMEILIQGPAQ